MNKLTIVTLAGLSTLTANAMGEAVPTSWSLQTPVVDADRNVVFDTDAIGVKLPILWGFDTAWNDRGNIVRGVRYTGKDAVDVVRVSFQPWAEITEKGKLPALLRKNLVARMDNVKLIGKKVDIALNLDGGENTVKSVYGYLDANDNYVGDKDKVADAYAMLIDATAAEVQDMGYTVVSAAPFNEPDYFWNGTPIDVFHKIDQRLKDASQYPRFQNIRISGGNTLNCDQALPWYTELKEYLDEGNTHQLAGDFDHYADFFKTVRADGKHATADELHNVMEAMVGVEYGMQTGIWWGTAEQARGEFCKASEGERLGYAENRQAWSAASVYRNAEGEIMGFLGCSERQARPSSYSFVSRNGAMFFDGYGPAREFKVDLPGDPNGAYQTELQRNAETMVRITNGEDVQPYIYGSYGIINQSTGLAVSGKDGSTSNGTEIIVSAYNKSDDQLWTVSKIPNDTGGDFSYYFIRNTKSNQALDDLNWNIEVGGKVIAYSPSSSGVQQWSFEYDGDGYFHIRNKQSALYLEGGASGNAVLQKERADIAAQRWRLVPAVAKYETTAPIAPQTFSATPRSGAILLEWSAVGDLNPVTYSILRSENREKDYCMIARGIEGLSFLDNSAVSGRRYYYKIMTEDLAVNRSQPSNPIEAAVIPGDMTAWLPLNGSLEDRSGNGNDGIMNADAVFREGPAEDLKALNIRRQGQFLKLPYALLECDKFSVSIRARRTGAAGLLFATGIDEDESLSLNLNADGKLCLAAVNGGVKAEITTEAIPEYEWAHYAVTYDGTTAALYVNGHPAGTADLGNAMPCDRILTYIARDHQMTPAFFTGYISDIRTYNYALCSAEVLNIAREETMGTDNVLSDSETVTIAYFNLQGQRLDAPLSSGVTIVLEVYANGETRTRKLVR